MTAGAAPSSFSVGHVAHERGGVVAQVVPEVGVDAAKHGVEAVVPAPPEVGAEALEPLAQADGVDVDGRIHVPASPLEWSLVTRGRMLAEARAVGARAQEADHADDVEGVPAPSTSPAAEVGVDPASVARRSHEEGVVRRIAQVVDSSRGRLRVDELRLHTGGRHEIFAGIVGLRSWRLVWPALPVFNFEPRTGPID